MVARLHDFEERCFHLYSCTLEESISDLMEEKVNRTKNSVENISARIDDIYFKENMTKMSLYKVELRLQKLEDFTFEAIEQLNSLKNVIVQHYQPNGSSEHQLGATTSQAGMAPIVAANTTTTTGLGLHPTSNHQLRKSRQNLADSIMMASLYRNSFRHRTITVGGGVGSGIGSGAGVAQNTTYHLHANNHSFPGQPNMRARLFNQSLSNIETTSTAAGAHMMMHEGEFSANDALSISSNARALNTSMTSRKRFQSEMQDYTQKSNSIEEG